MLCDCHAYATLPAVDLERARKFYEEVLGFKASDVTPGGIFFDARGSSVFVYPSQYAGTNQATSVAFDTDDLSSLADELRRKGVRFEEYDYGEWKTENGIMKMGDGKAAWFKDSEGNIVGVFEPAKAHSWPKDATVSQPV